MKNTTIAALIAAPLLVCALAMPSLAAAAPSTTCKDGTTTTSTGKGTCSGHGGVQKAAKTPCGEHRRRRQPGRHRRRTCATYDQPSSGKVSQRPWRNTESHEVQIGIGGHGCRTCRCREVSGHGARGRSGCRIEHRRQSSYGEQVCAHGSRQ